MPDAESCLREIARRNMWFCMIEEPVGLAVPPRLSGSITSCGSPTIPHADTPFPHTQAACEAVFAGVPRDEIDAITHGNAEALFDFPLTPRRS